MSKKEKKQLKKEQKLKLKCINITLKIYKYTEVDPCIREADKILKYLKGEQPKTRVLP